MKDKFLNIKRLAVILAIIIIPIMYSFFFLDAFWDPYSKLENLPVAVVNEDKGATINDQQKNAGQDFVDELKDNKSLKWIFTNKAEAQEGLKDRKYYAMIQIPENFSAKIATAETKDKQQAVISYQPQQKRNYLASQILNRAILELEMNVSQKVTKEMVQYISDENKKMPDQLTELSDGLKKMQTDGTSKLEDGLNTLINNQVKFNNGLNTLNNGMDKLNNGADALAGGNKTLASKQEEFAQALHLSIPQLQQLSDGSNLFHKKLATLDSGLFQLNSGVSQLTTKLPELKAGISAYNQGLKDYTSGLTTFGQGVAPLGTQLQPLKSGSTQLYNNLTAYSTNMEEFSKGVSQYTDGVKTLTSTNKSVADALTEYIKAHPEAMADKNIQSILAISQKSQSSIEQLNKASDTLKTSAGGLSTASQQLAAGSKQLNEGVSKFVDGAPQLASAAQQLAAGSNALVTGGEKISAGIDSLNSGTTQLTQGIAQASSGATQLNKGYSQIDTGIQKASGSISVAASAAAQLAEGASKLGAGASELKNGVQKASNGASELSTNAQKFLDGEKELHDGAGTLDDKVEEAYKKIVDKEEEANDKVSKLDGLAEYVSDPVKVDEKAVDPVSDYGTAFAPYFISLSLWVGALIMFVMIYLNPQIRFKKKIIKNMHMDIKFLIYPALGVITAIGLGLVLINELKLKPTHTGMFFLVITLVSLCFISIVQFLIVHLGDVGKFFTILLLILQLTSSGGTFPNELIPGFFKTINPFMPMTYSVYALKETISGNNSNFLNQNILIIAVIMVVFLVASLLLSGRKKARLADDEGSEFIPKNENSSIQA